MHLKQDQLGLALFSTKERERSEEGDLCCHRVYQHGVEKVSNN